VFRVFIPLDAMICKILPLRLIVIYVACLAVVENNRDRGDEQSWSVGAGACERSEPVFFEEQRLWEGAKSGTGLNCLLRTVQFLPVWTEGPSVGIGC
jgi:hypothetical protein